MVEQIDQQREPAVVAGKAHAREVLTERHYLRIDGHWQVDVGAHAEGAVLADRT